MMAKRLHKEMLKYDFPIACFFPHCRLHSFFEQEFRNMLGETILYVLSEWRDRQSPNTSFSTNTRTLGLGLPLNREGCLSGPCPEELFVGF